MDEVRQPPAPSAAALTDAFIDPEKLLSLNFPVLFSNPEFYSTKYHRTPAEVNLYNQDSDNCSFSQGHWANH